ncbi:type IV pilus modification PilV family protein [Variovorax terrae]|uniref:Type IV pilus modification protein PilV n=1 Tax=Variovorax terrae TaxID=2923278 RepID=A0A9X2ASC6_9BURK|nr:hypothetical protein [Variovorax terrae]MCJ0765186.1 hypothetical protein [Variovorax terrae]
MKHMHAHAVRRSAFRQQAGIMLLEALAAILIFSVGILAVIGLQAASVKQAAAAEFRSIAALQANDLVSRMWISDHTAATLQTVYGSSGSGAGYASWLAHVKASGLPGVSSVSPTVVFGDGVTAPANQVTITVNWIAPGETTAHNYVVIAQVK